MKITIETRIQADLDTLWRAWNNPDDIKQWNAASDDWHTTHSTVDLREGGHFLSRMEARDASAGFDFEGVYTRIEPLTLIRYRMGDGREVETTFTATDGAVQIRTVFDADASHSADMQRAGWQAILDNFARYVTTRR